MASKRIAFKRIDDEAKRNATFIRLTNDIRKRVHELVTVFNVDAAVIIVSPWGEVITISGTTSVEDIVLRYLRHHTTSRGGHIYSHITRNRQQLINTIMRKKLMEKLSSQLTRVEVMMDEGIDLETFYAEYSELWENICNYKNEIPKITKMKEFVPSARFAIELLKRARIVSARLEWTMHALELTCYKKLHDSMRLNAGNHGLPPSLNSNTKLNINLNINPAAPPNNPVPLSKRKIKFLKAPIMVNGMQGVAGGGSNGSAA